MGSRLMSKWLMLALGSVLLETGANGFPPRKRYTGYIVAIAKGDMAEQSD